MLDKHLDLRDRTKRFALRVLKLCGSLPKTEAARTISGSFSAPGPPSRRTIGPLAERAPEPSS